MSCKERDNVAALLLGGVTQHDRVRLEEHLLSCDECSDLRRELSIVRTMLDTLDKDEVEPPAELLAEVSTPDAMQIEAITRVRQRRGRREIRHVALAAAAAFLIGVVPLGLWTASHREPTLTVELAGTAAAPDAWASVRFLPRTEGTIVDVEAGDLPTTGGRYAVTVSNAGAVLARQEFTVDTDGWAQVVLATTQPVQSGDTVVVERVDGQSITPVLTCDCTI